VHLSGTVQSPIVRKALPSVAHRRFAFNSGSSESYYRQQCERCSELSCIMELPEEGRCAGSSGQQERRRAVGHPASGLAQFFTRRFGQGLSRSTDTHPCPRKIVGRIEAAGFLETSARIPAPRGAGAQYLYFDISPPGTNGDNMMNFPPTYPSTETLK
jgi:hypothetical protein